MKKEKGNIIIFYFLTLVMILFAVPVTVRAAGAGRTPTRSGKLELSAPAEKNEGEGWEWEPNAAGGGTLTLTDCYIQSGELQTLYFGNIAEGHTITIVLKGENIIETTSQKYGCMISANSYNGNTTADVIIREEGEGSLEVRTSEPITTGNSPIGFNSRSLKIESGSISSNIEICLLTEEFLMQGGSLVVQTPERINDVFGICSVAGPVNIKGGTVDITAGHIGIITSGENGEGWSVNISGGDVRIKARQSCIQMQNRRGLPESRVINITGGTFTGESDITGLYADDIRIVKEGEKAPQVTINAPGDAGNPNIKAIHALKELAVSDSIVMADTIHNYDTSSKVNCIVVQGGNGQVYGEVTLDSSLKIPDGSTLTIPENAVLNIPENVLLTLPAGTDLVNNGTLVLPESAGDISCTGTGVIKKGEEIYSNELVRLYPVTVETAGEENKKYYKAGDIVKLMPEEAPEGKVFKEWKVIPDTVEITDNSFRMPESAVTVSPVYEDIQFEIAVNASPKEGGTVTGNGKVKKGESVTVSAAANSGYTFVGWTEDGQKVSADAKYTFTASADRVLTACFVREDIQFEIAVNANPKEGGTVTGNGKVKKGEPVTVSAAANSGYTFVGWTENGQKVSADAKYTFTASADRILTACFEKTKKEDTGKTEGKNYAIGTICLTKTSGVYNGKIQRPSVTVKDSKGNILKQNADYTVSYPKNMKNVGIYTVTVTLLGNYEGTRNLSYKIVPKGTAISKIKAKKKGFTLKWKKQKTQTTGYEIQYSTSKKFTKKTTNNVIVKKNKTISKSISKRKANKKYYVRIRTYKNIRVNGKTVKITSGWSKAKAVKTKK